MVSVLPTTGKGGTFTAGLRRGPYPLGHEAVLTCSRGYQAPVITTSRVVSKQGTLAWEPSEIHCEPVSVLNDLPKTGAGGTFQPDRNAQAPFHLKDRAVLTCDRGYLLPRIKVSTVVLKNGQLIWEPDPVDCEPVQCVDPPVVKHGYADSTAFSFQNSFSYVCDAGYRFNASVNRFTCNAEGHWDPPIPGDAACVKVQCPELKQPLNAHMISYGREVGSIATFECHPGYVGVYGDQLRKCEKDGTWSGKDYLCQLKQAPVASLKSNPFLIFLIILYSVYWITLMMVWFMRRRNRSTLIVIH